MRRAWLLVFLAGCDATPVTRDPNVYACTVDRTATLSTARAEALDALVADATRTFPGIVAYAETPEGTWFAARGFADLDTRAPMQPCTRMRAGSVSKTYVALAAMRLAEQGKLDLDAPVSSLLSADVLKGLANADRATVRQLLNHTSGIPHGLDDTGIALSFLFGTPTKSLSTAQYLDGVRGLPAAFPVGTSWRYSNTNYTLLGLILEAVTGESLATVLEQQVSKPLALTGSSYLEQPADVTPARGYFDYRGDGVLIDSTNFMMGQRTAAGGVVSTVFDLATVVKTAARDARLQQWVEIPEGRAAAPNHTGYGLGVMRWQTPHGNAVGHGGVLFGWQTWAFSFEPERHVTWVVAVNADFGKTSTEFEALQNRAVTALFSP